MPEVDEELFNAGWLAEAAAEVNVSSLETGEPVTFAVVLLGGPRKETACTWRFDSSSVTAEPGAAPDAAVTFSVPWKDGLAILSGDLQPSVAYMQGRLKTAGDFGLILQLLEWSATPEFDGWRQRVTAGE